MVDASEPPVLFGHNEAPNPAEFVLHALAGCLTLTIVNVAAARKVTLTEVSSTLEGVLDARGATGLDDSLPQRLRAHPRLLLDQGRRARARSSRRSSSAPSRAPSSTTSSPTRSPSTCMRGGRLADADGAHRPHAGRQAPRRDSPSGSPTTSRPRPAPTTATAATRSRASTRCASRLLRRARARGARRPRRELRPRRRSSPRAGSPGATRRSRSASTCTSSSS